MADQESPSDRWASREKAIALAQDSSKQLITICTAILSAILAAMVLGRSNLTMIAPLLSGAALSCLISILSGIFTLYALSGILENGLQFKEERPLMTRNYRVSALIQLGLFFLTCLLILLGIFCIAWLGAG